MRDKPEPVGDEQQIAGSDSNERIERTDVGVSIEFSMTRGTETRDQEKIKVKAKGETFDDAREDMERAKDYVRESLAPDLREIHPEVQG